MRRSTQDPPRVEFSTLIEAKRVTLDADGLLVEGREFFGTWYPTARVFWDEVRAVYAWDRPNWRLLPGVVIALLILFLGFFGTTTEARLVLFTLGGGATVILAGLWVLRFRRQRWVRVDSTVEPIEFPLRRPQVLDALLARLPLE